MSRNCSCVQIHLVRQNQNTRITLLRLLMTYRQYYLVQKFRSRLVLLVDKKLNWKEIELKWIVQSHLWRRKDRFSLIGATTLIVPIRSLSVIWVIYLHRIFVCFGLPRLVMSMKVRELSVIYFAMLLRNGNSHRIFVCFGLPRLVMSMKFPLF